jgi:hypothetical protein
MTNYIFILKKEENGETYRKGMYFKDVDEYLSNGWKFNNSKDYNIYLGLQKFYMVMNNVEDR